MFTCKRKIKNCQTYWFKYKIDTSKKVIQFNYLIKIIKLILLVIEY